MPVPHLNIRIVQRSKGNSAVAGAAYQAGDKLFSEYDQKHKDHRRKQHEVVYTEIMLPTNAPPEYADRATLWNSAEEVEKQWNSQLARRFVVALPREMPLEMCPQMMQEYCNEHFVSKGMCCDFAIHDPDPPGHNPHCHIMLTMRAIDENGKWMPKSRKVYDLDENGERIKLPSGRWKSHKEDTVDWNEQYHAEEWRHGWEVIQNKYLELAGSAERVDMRSYERQGLDIIPTVHMGAAVSALERKGIETNIGNLNRDIKAANRMMNAIRSTIKSLRDWIADILEATKEAFAEVEAEKKNASPNLSNLLRDYMNLRKSERSEWSRYGQQKGTADDLKAVSKALIYLKEHELFTLEDLDTALQGVNEKAGAISKEMKTASNRMKVITAIQTAVADCKTHKAVHDKYLKIGWKARQAAYAESHKDELDSFNKAFRYLKKQGVDLNVNLDALQTEYDKLKATHTELAGQLATVKEELQPMKDIRYWVGKVLTPEQAVEKKPEPKHSVTEKMKFLQEQGKNEAFPLQVGVDGDQRVAHVELPVELLVGQQFVEADARGGDSLLLRHVLRTVGIEVHAGLEHVEPCRTAHAVPLFGDAQPFAREGHGIEVVAQAQLLLHEVVVFGREGGDEVLDRQPGLQGALGLQLLEFRILGADAEAVEEGPVHRQSDVERLVVDPVFGDRVAPARRRAVVVQPSRVSGREVNGREFARIGRRGVVVRNALLVTDDPYVVVALESRFEVFAERLQLLGRRSEAKPEQHQREERSFHALSVFVRLLRSVET